MVTSRPNRLAIPVKAVVERRGKKMVRVVDGAAITYIPVTLGEQIDQNIEVLSGLKAGDRILVEKSGSFGSSGKKGNNRNRGGMGGSPPMRM
jgi:multidrug efflux pump subunit AcrA (membrane-fusion protein)